MQFSSYRFMAFHSCSSLDDFVSFQRTKFSRREIQHTPRGIIAEMQSRKMFLQCFSPIFFQNIEFCSSGVPSVLWALSICRSIKTSSSLHQNSLRRCSHKQARLRRTNKPDYISTLFSECHRSLGLITKVGNGRQRLCCVSSIMVSLLSGENAWRHRGRRVSHCWLSDLIGRRGRGTGVCTERLDVTAFTAQGI